MKKIISKNEVPDIRTGDIVRVIQKIKEGNKEREQPFEGVVIKRGSGSGPNAFFVVRRISQGIGVERKFLLHSPTLVKIKIKKRSKVKRAYLSYLRNYHQLTKSLKDKKIEPFEAILTKGIEKVEKIETQETQKNKKEEKSIEKKEEKHDKEKFEKESEEKTEKEPQK